MKFYSETKEKVLEALQSTNSGLSNEQAAQRAERDGKNKLEQAKGKSVLARFFQQLADPMIIILLAAAIISGVLAVVENEGFTDVIIILAVVIVNAVLGVYQESKAEKAIEALQKMAAATSRVMREGKIQTLPSEDLVAGDIIFLEAGDAVPADARILSCASLKTEEAALTGESVPVEKTDEAIVSENDVPLGDRKNMVYMGSTVAYGRGSAVVTKTGMKTEMGKIAGVLQQAQDGETPLQKKLDQLSKVLTWLVLAICVVVFAVQLIRTGSFDFEFVLSSFMIAVSLAVAAIPEGLAAVVTVVLSIGVTNMSKRNAIIRKLTAVETLGCAQIICSDKTGTLTQNKMTVVESYGDDIKKTAEAFSLCTDASLLPGKEESEGDPTQTAVVNYALKLGIPKYESELNYPRVGEIPFDSKRKLMTTVHCVNGKFEQYTTGAPDVVLLKCAYVLENGKQIKLDENKRKEILDKNKEFADKALRVLAAGVRFYDAAPQDYDPEKMENELCFLGLVGMIDPVRPEVLEAIHKCREAGIRPIMITGDHIDTAVAIAKDLGIVEDRSGAVTGAELDAMSDDEFNKRLKDISVYARVQPEHKTRIVNAWRSAGFITAMTGDGVNDAPSIKAADIGIGMGITGTDVTKNVADMVLADDNFATIVGAVEEGRRIYDNIRKAIQFLLGSNMSEVMSIFFATLMGFTVLKPVHLLWINLVTDCFPALALGTEKAEPGIMKRKPRSASDGVFAGGMGFDIAYQGIVITLLVLASYFIGHSIETGNWEIANSDAGTTMAFLTMSMAEIFHSFNMRSQRASIFRLHSHNKLLIFAAIASLITTTAVCEIPFMANAFGFTSVELNEYLIAIGLGVLIIPIVEIVKLVQRKIAKKK